MMARDWRLERAVLYTLSPLSATISGSARWSPRWPAAANWCVHDLPRGDSLVDRLEETGAAFLFGVPTHAIDLLGRDARARRARGSGRCAASASPARRRRRRWSPS